MNEQTATDGLSPAQLHWTAQGEPISDQYGDVYFSREHGLDETRYVFLAGCSLPERIAQLQPGQTLRIAETGFGTGLNFLATWALFARLAPVGARLHFASVEKHPLKRADLIQAHSLWPELAPFAAALAAIYPTGGHSRLLQHPFEQGRITLSVYWGDVEAALAQWLPGLAGADYHGHQLDQLHYGESPITFDSWFLDGFSPAKNPAMWQPALYNAMAWLSKPGTQVATFTAAGHVKRGLCAAGFTVRKTPGFGPKRERLVAVFTGPAPQLAPKPESAERRRRQSHRLWSLSAPSHALHPASSAGDIAVIGAGMAGCHTARALAERGLRVQLFDQAELASGASGNPVGLVFAKLSPAANPQGEFNEVALRFAQHFYRQGYYQTCGLSAMPAGEGIGHLDDPSAPEFFAALMATYPDPQEMHLEPAPALAQTADGRRMLITPGGCLKPAILCRALIDHPHISLHNHTKLMALHPLAEGGAWLEFAGGRSGFYRRVVLAQSVDLRRLSLDLPLKAIRGQVSYAELAQPLPLTRPLCAGSYLTPSWTEAGVTRICYGATFDLHTPYQPDTPAPYREADDLDNLAELRKLAPGLDLSLHNPSGRASYRATTPDYLPLVGPLTATEAFCRHYARLRKNRSAKIPGAGPTHPGLYVHTGLGARGLAYSPICAAIIASLITGEPLPVTDDLYAQLHPARFLIRDLARNKR